MRTAVAILVTAVATAAAMKVAEVGAATNTLTANAFQLEDAGGNKRGFFGFDASGNAVLSICDVGGPCATISRDGFKFTDDAGNVRSRLYLDSNGRSRLDLCDADNHACLSVIENEVVVYDGATGAQSETVDLSSRGLFLAYPGAGNFTDREAASFITDTYLGSDLCALTIGARNLSAFSRAPDSGFRIATGKPTTSTPAPFVSLSMLSGGKYRVDLESGTKKTLYVYKSNGKTVFSR